MVLLFVLLLLPISVSAGLVGALSGMFIGENNEDSLLKNNNIQTMEILAPSSILSKSAEAYEYLVVDHDALVSNSGPRGEVNGDSTHNISSDQISIYIVRNGDTLSEIAKMFDVSVNTIKWGNDLSSNTLKEGQTLVILPITGVKHVVKKGNTLLPLPKNIKETLKKL